MIQPDQSQHRISQVYLRSWSFKDKRKADTLCVTKVGDHGTFYQSVKKFTAETNLFDTTLFDEGHERFFDKKSIIAETNFDKVLKALSKGSYDGQTRIYLAEFAANLFVRQTSTFNDFKFIVERKPLREKLLKEIAALDEHDSLIEAVYEEMIIDPEHTLDSKVGAIVVQAWKHFLTVFKRFKHVILRAPTERAWFTTDNPVIVRQNGKDGWIAGTDAEIYFPVSKEYLVYMHLEGQHPHNPLAGYAANEITQISLEVYDHIMHRIIIKSKPKFLIMPEDMGYMDVRDGSELSWYKPSPDAGDDEIPFSFLGTPLPPAPDDPDLARLLSTMSLVCDPVIVDVETYADAVENECIAIVDKMVREFGGSRILGWQFWKGAYLIEAEFHAVWRTPDGVLKDVSIKKSKVTKIVFAADQKLVYKGTQIDNVRLNLFDYPIVDDFIQVCDIQFKLNNKDGRATLYGQEFADSLTAGQLANLQGVEYFKQLLMKFLNDGGNENSNCFCNRNRKYKDCHRLLISELHKLD